jgi:RNA polymerase sigma-70 factor (ECF subfamily)
MYVTGMRGSMIMHISEKELMQYARAGNVAAFEELMRLYQPMLYRLVLSLSLNPDDAEDAMQESMLQAFRSIKTFRGDSSFKTWLFRITVNTCRNWLRKESRASSQRFAEVMPIVSFKPEEQPEYIAIYNQERKRVLLALSSLPDHYREVVILRHYHDLSYQEISDILKVPIGTVRSRLSQGREILAKKLNAVI